MKESSFSFSVASDIDFEELIADIGINNELVAILTQEEGFQDLRIRIYPPKNKKYWDFKWDDFEKVVQNAKMRLWELRRTSNNSSKEDKIINS